jgi:eukaryotic-like serine/threonine-protein kinase
MMGGHPRWEEITKLSIQRSKQVQAAVSGIHPLAVGKYRVLAELGRGGMAVVYLAVIRGSIGKLVVLKALRPELASEPEAVAMFLDEARLATQLSHTNVVQTYEVGTEGDRHVIVMEYLEGQALHAVMHRAEAHGQPLPIELHLSILLNVLDGLHYAHEVRGYDGAPLALVHRDVSPQNVFLTYDGQVKLLDFGIAKAATSTDQTSTGLLKGKMAYMAPEQMTGSPIDRRADIFAVGCMLWSMAAGRKLWQDVPNLRIYHQVKNGGIPSPRTANPECDQELERIVMKALALDPEERYASALALHEDLERYGRRFERAKGKGLGARVAELFQDERRDLRLRVERDFASLQQEEGSTTLSGAQRTNLVASVDISPSASRTGSRRRPSARPFSWLPTKGGKALGIVGGLTLALAATLLLASKPTTSVGSALATELHAAKPLTAPVALVFEASPAEAKLSLDGEPLLGNPVTKLLPRDERVHRITVTSDGYISVTREFVVESPLTISVELVKAEAATHARRNHSASAPSKGKRPTGSVTLPAAPAAKRPNCTDAFYIDVTGTRRIRPECL